MAEQSLRELDLPSLMANRRYFPSPEHWEDEVIYFLMVDRFSDGQENFYRDNQGHRVTTGATPLFAPSDNGDAVRTASDASRWRERERGLLAEPLPVLNPSWAISSGSA